MPNPTTELTVVPLQQAPSTPDLPRPCYKLKQNELLKDWLLTPPNGRAPQGTTAPNARRAAKAKPVAWTC